MTYPRSHKGEKGRALPSARAGRASPETACGLGHSATIANAPYHFFIVWSPEGPTPPRVVHGTHQDAHAVAWLMAKRFKGNRFFVMQRVGRGAQVLA